MPPGIAWMLACYSQCPYQSDAKPPFFSGDLCLRDGVERVTDLGKQVCGDDDFMVWDGVEWHSLKEQMARVIPVQKMGS